jgi:hypothetical protein
VINQDGKTTNTDTFTKMRMGRIMGIAAGHLNL